ncbi:hypothetical protein [Curtobacterium sp. VKM Ac-1393]|uniref:hypothetical protein n=1 Tax=Curtobacterium sp. VKM Ac-1393 TaxID=2783814 RepID=UPI00188D9A54|nr:hypothetical protein [Curtobacterium sp. VKM Ac-1393]MBF4606060.1 hypothetical protein [Curtobacterium sp. VKM Ac-1393]
MFKIGWQVYRERLPELVDQRARRRVVHVGVLVAGIVFVGLLLVGLLLGGATPFAAWVVVAVLGAAGSGCVGAAFTPIGPKGWAVPPVPGIGWRTQEAVARYYRRNPPPVAPEHRDAVLRRMPESRDLIVRSAFRAFLLLGSWVGIILGTAVLDVTLAVGDDTAILFPGVWVVYLFVSGGTGVLGIRTLGRQEQLRVEAEALPPVPPAPPARGRPGTPNGSKLSLPGE